MSRRRKGTLVAGVGAAALLVIGLGAAGAVAAAKILSPSDASKAVIEDALRTALDGKTLAQVAKDRGKSVSGLVAALVVAENKRIDEAVASGRLTKDQAADLEAGVQDRMQALVNGELPARDHFRGRS